MHKHIYRERRVVRSYLINRFHRGVYDSAAAQAERRTFKECNLRSVSKFSPHSHMLRDCNEKQPCNEGRWILFSGSMMIKQVFRFIRAASAVP